MRVMVVILFLGLLLGASCAYLQPAQELAASYTVKAVDVYCKLSAADREAFIAEVNKQLADKGSKATAQINC